MRPCGYFFRWRKQLGLLLAMNVEDSIWDKLTRVVIGLLLLAFLVAVGVWYLPLIRQNERTRREVMRLDQKLAEQTAEQRQLNTAIEQSNDPKAIERLAREKFGYAKPGETVIRFEESTNSYRAQ
jgi:cell division protein FtsB